MPSCDSCNASKNYVMREYHTDGEKSPRHLKWSGVLVKTRLSKSYSEQHCAKKMMIFVIGVHQNEDFCDCGPAAWLDCCGKRAHAFPNPSQGCCNFFRANCSGRLLPRRAQSCVAPGKWCWLWGQQHGESAVSMVASHFRENGSAHFRCRASPWVGFWWSAHHVAPTWSVVARLGVGVCVRWRVCGLASARSRGNERQCCLRPYVFFLINNLWY